MKLTNRQIITAIDALSSICEQDLPVKLSFKIFTIHEALEEKYKVYLKTLEKIKDNEEKVKELLEIENDIQVTPFSIDEIENSSIKLKPVHVYGLKGLIDG